MKYSMKNVSLNILFLLSYCLCPVWKMVGCIHDNQFVLVPMTSVVGDDTPDNGCSGSSWKPLLYILNIQKVDMFKQSFS